MRRLTIGMNAHLLSFSASYRSAGVSRYIYNLMAELPHADRSLDYVAYTGDALLHMPGWRMRVSRWPTARPPARILWEQAVQPWALRRDRIDLLHAPAYVGPLAGSPPMVVTIHDLSFFLYPEMFRSGNRAYLQRFTQLSARRAVRLLADSQSTRRDIQEILGINRSRIEVIYPGVGSEMRPIRDMIRLAALRTRYSLPERFVLFVGTLEPRKNIKLLIQAFAQLHERNVIPHKLVVVGGKGWFYQELEEQVEALGLGDRVLFPGYVPDAELALWYNAADLLLYPSHYEGFGLPPLEAMACGTPVIVSDRASLPEVVGHAGIKLSPEDPARWAEMIAELLASPAQMATMREAGLRRAASFTWQAAAKATTEIYHQVIHDDR